MTSEHARSFITYSKKITDEQAEKGRVVADISDMLQQQGYQVVETNADKPWGAYFRIANEQAEQFIAEFFPGLTLEEAQLGIEGASLSPKILIVSPGQRLSWQLHHRRAERWRFLSGGAYNKSMTDDEGDLVSVQADHEVQFAKEERHRLCASPDGFTLVAEIWQHVDSEQLSDEDDIVRLQDDYKR